MKRAPIRLLSVLFISLLCFTLVILAISNMVTSTSAYDAPGRLSARSYSAHCAEFPNSSYYQIPPTTRSANPENWVQIIRTAQPYDEILLADGLYPLEQYSVVLNQPITLRSASGNNQAVVIEGKGYGVDAEALMILADDVHIADLTVRNVRDHAISIKEGFARTVIYNVDLIDIGTQHIKGNRMGPDGVIACSQIGYTKTGGKGDYNSAIDLHGAVNWSIKDNTIYNIYGDGSGCIVDTRCGTLYPGGEPAILLWKDSRDNIIERNAIIDSYRGITLGLNTPYTGGTVRNNFICRSNPGRDLPGGYIDGDAGISLLSASDVTVEGNTLILPGDYQGHIEIKNATGISVKNNTMSEAVWNKGNAEYNGCHSASCQDQQFGNTTNAIFSNLDCQSVDALAVASLAAREDSFTLAEIKLAALELRMITRDYPLNNREQLFKQWEKRLLHNQQLSGIELLTRSTNVKINLLKRKLLSIIYNR